MKTISYAITCCNELKELQRLANQIVGFMGPDDELVIQQDCTNLDTDVMTSQTKAYISAILLPIANVRYLQFNLEKDFATFKNNLKSNCKKDYIVFLDADEYLSDNLMEHIRVIVENNPVDVFLVPRMNTVEGLTQEHINKWGWRVNEDSLINWPDFQMRIVANKDHLKWKNKVHEVIDGYTTLSQFPIDNYDWCLIHPKTIEKQEQQNEFYSKL